MTFKKNNPGCPCCAPVDRVHACSQCNNGEASWLILAELSTGAWTNGTNSCSTGLCNSLEGTYILSPKPGGTPGTYVDCVWRLDLSTSNCALEFIEYEYLALTKRARISINGSSTGGSGVTYLADLQVAADPDCLNWSNKLHRPGPGASSFCFGAKDVLISAYSTAST